MDQIFSTINIDSALENIKPYLKKSPLFKSKNLSNLFGAEIYLKDETVHPTNTFKPRGALNHIINAKKKNPSLTGIVTTSTGNHGQAVAYAGKLLGVSAHIFLPENPNKLKEEKIKTIGAEIYKIGKDSDTAKESAEKFAKENSFEYIDDGESFYLIEGTSTIGFEINEDLKDIDYVFVPMGSGTLVTGIAYALKKFQKNIKVISVQPAGSPAMTESFHAKKPIERPINTIADGTVCRVPAKLTLAGIINFVDNAILVSEEEILSAIAMLIQSDNKIIEPSTAVGLAGAFKMKDKMKNKKIVIVLTGANILPEYLELAKSYLAATCQN